MSSKKKSKTNDSSIASISEEVYGTVIFFLYCPARDLKKHILKSKSIVDTFGDSKTRDHVTETPAPDSHGETTTWVNKFKDNDRLYILIWINSETITKSRGFEHLAGIVAHESLHASIFALKRLQVEVDVESQEAICYYIQWIVLNLTKWIKDKW